MRRTIPAAALLLATPALAQPCDLADPIELIADNAIGYAHAGFAVAASDEIVVVGAYGDDRVLVGAGSVAVYRKSGTDWIQEADLLPGNAARGDWFGYSVATDGERIAVGVPYGFVEGIKTGRVVVYRFDDTAGWVAEDTLTAPDYAFNDQFGTSVAIDDGMIIVGAPGRDSLGAADSGAAYAFALNEGGGWQHAGTLQPGSLAGSRVGVSVALDMPHAIIGAPFDNPPGDPQAGRAFSYIYDGFWGAATLLPSAQPESGDGFGWSVAIHNGVAVVGAPDATVGSLGVEEYGYVEVFELETNGWNRAQILHLNGNPLNHDDEGLHFGSSVGVHNNMIIVGMPGHTSRTGGMRIFAPDNSGVWVPEPVAFRPAGIPIRSAFGTSVAVSESAAVAGADLTDFPDTNAGSAWVYTVVCPCPADLDGNNMLNFFDIAAYVSAYNAGDPIADLADPAGVFNFFDIAAYIGLYNAGCP